jgi:hypothetical protein
MCRPAWRFAALRLSAACVVLCAGCVEIPETQQVLRDFGADAVTADMAVDAATDAAPPDARVCDGTPEDCQFGPPVQTLTQADVKPTRVVLAVDCGPDMDEPLEPGTTRREAVVSAVGALIDLGLELEYGLVLFDGRVRRVTPVDLDPTQEDVRAALAVHGTGEGRDWSLGLRAASDLFDERDDGTRDAARAIVLLTAGPPDAPAPDPAAEAAEQADASRATVFAVDLGNADAEAFGRVAGGRVLAPADADALAGALAGVPAALPCAAGPLERRPADGEAVRLFLRRDAGAETLLPVAPDLAADPATAAFTYDADAGLALLSPALCDAVRAGAEVVVRMGPP